MNTTAKPIRIILVDNQPNAMGNINTALGLSPALLLVGQAADTQEAIQLCQRILPEVVLVNLKAPGLEGTSVVRLVTNQWPQITVLVLSDTGEEEKLHAALGAGASGYLPHDADPETLAGTIEHVVAGRREATRAPDSSSSAS